LVYTHNTSTKTPAATIADYAPLGSQLFQLHLTAELLQAEMGEGRVLFLLDGLDEIIDTTWRRKVGEHIEAFASSCQACRVVVTWRIVGYREARLGASFTEFSINPFGEPEILQFAESWYQALGDPGRAAALADAILPSDSIRRLASNPLLLTVIALIHFRRTKLPHQRVKLYQLAAETLVDQWMSERRVIPEEWNVQETLDVLPPAIAWHLHETTSSGLIDDRDLHELLVETIRQHAPRLSERTAYRRAAQFRRNVAEFSGIFPERGLDQDGRGIYGFLHLTFEEYFAAARLGELWDREGSRVLKPLLHDPRWLEIILLAAGRFSEFSQYQASRFVRAVVEAGVNTRASCIATCS
jgi:predicted NACHT family NTPase